MRLIFNVGYQYMRNASEADAPDSSGNIDISTAPLIRTRTSTTGFRFVIQGFRYAKLFNINYAGMVFVFLAFLPYIFDFIILLIHPNSTQIHDKKYRQLKEKEN
mmetsp:Transcript_21060/g.18680  ORF Transcript_21060/g.18680 Transcript_21060/m.18680 type:complete len:104 (+) Transcript_21060:271-582(+)